MITQKDLYTIKAKAINNLIAKVLIAEKKCLSEKINNNIKTPELFMSAQGPCNDILNIIKHINFIANSDFEFSWKRGDSADSATYLTTNKNKYMAQAKKIVDQFLKEEKLLNI